MAIKTIDDTSLYNIANAIREKNGLTTLYRPDQMAEAIRNIVFGGPDWRDIGYTGIPATVQNGFDYAVEIKDSWDPTTTDRSSGHAGTFRNDWKLVYFPHVDFSNVQNIQNGFDNCIAFSVMDEDLDFKNIQNAQSAFINCKALDNVVINNIGSNKSSCNCYNMFKSCYSLKNATINLEDVTNADRMFSDCQRLQYINVGTSDDYPNDSIINSSKITDANHMLEGCYDVRGTVRIDLPSCTNAEQMFVNATNSDSIRTSNDKIIVYANLPALTSSAGARSMFYLCPYLKEAYINLYGYDDPDYGSESDPGSFTSLEGMFNGCTRLEGVKLGPWRSTGNVTSTREMFLNCSSLNMHYDDFGVYWGIPSFDTSKVTDMRGMFSGCTNLTKLPTPWDTSKVTQFDNMFLNCPNLSDDAISDIMEMCINADTYNQGSGEKTLYKLGFRSNVYSVDRISGCLNYENFLNAGWTCYG